MAENVREIPPPVLLSAMVCDMVILDAMSKKCSLIGIFDTINAPGYPTQHHSLWVFCQLTNGRAQVDVCLRIVDLEDEERTIGEANMKTEFADVRQVANVILRVEGLTFPHPGEYRVQVFAGTEFLGERRILCKLLPPQTGESS